METETPSSTFSEPPINEAVTLTLLEDPGVTEISFSAFMVRGIEIVGSTYPTLPRSKEVNQTRLSGPGRPHQTYALALLGVPGGSATIYSVKRFRAGS